MQVLICALWLGVLFMIGWSSDFTYAQDTGSDGCTVASAGAVNLRSGPGTDYGVAGTLAAGQTAIVDGRATGSDGFIWWRLEDGTWVRSDVVNAQGACTDVALYTADSAIVENGIAPGDTVDGPLNPGETATWSLMVDTPGDVTIDLRSNQFDTYLTLQNASGEEIAANDDWGGSTSSRLVGISLTSGQQYLVTVQGFDERDSGVYSLNVHRTQNHEYPAIQAQAAYETGLTAFAANDYGTAVEHFEEALDGFRQANDTDSEGPMLYRIGVAYGRLGQDDAAQEVYGEAIPLLRAIGDQRLEAAIQNNLGDICARGGQYDRAFSHYQQALLIEQDMDNQEGAALTLYRMAQTYADIQQYEQALDHNLQALTAVREIDEKRGEELVLRAIAEIYELQEQYPQALEYYEAALVVHRERDNRSSESITLTDIAGIYLAQEQYAEALDYLEQALAIDRALDQPLDEAISLHNIGHVYAEQGQYDLALDYYWQALTIERRLDARAEEANTLKGIGVVYGEQGQTAPASDYMLEALSIRQEMNDQPAAAEVLFDLGNMDSDYGQFTDALDFYQQALAIYREIVDPEQEGTTLSNIGLIYHRRAQYTQALEYYRQALDIARDLDDLDLEATVLNNIGGIYSDQGQYSLARDYLQQALDIARETDDSYDKAVYLGNIAGYYHDVGQYDQALELYQEALAIHRGLDGRDSRESEGTILNSIGQWYSDQGQLDQALEYWWQALAVRREIGDRFGEGYTLNNIGAAYTERGQRVEALDYYHDALEIHRELGDRRGEITTLSNLGVNYEELGQIEQAIDYYSQAVEVIEAVHSDIRLESGQAAFSAHFTSRHPYDRLVTLLATTDPEQAFTCAERGRARAFLFQLGNEQLAFGQGADAQLLADWQTARDQIVALRARRVELANQLIPDATAISEIDDQIAEAERELTRLEDQIAVQNPAMSQLTRVDVPALATIQAAIPDDTTLLSFYFSDTDLFAFVLTGDGLVVERLVVPPGELEDSISTFRADERAQAGALAHLYTWLIEPLTAHLRTPHLVIAPHDILNYVPFGALVVEEGHYLTDDYTISYTPSATVYALLASTPPDLDTGGAALVLGNPDAADPGLRPLPFAEAEARAIATELNTEAALGSNATEGLLRREATQATVLHIAAHGLFNTVNPLSSFLALTPDAENDGFLEMREVYALPLQEHSPLVVLSACQTAVGELTEGDEFQGLTRAFLLSGAHTVVASLWSVDDQATSELMTAFYRYREQGMSDAEALAQAQATVRLNVDHPEWAEPYYWAAFVLTGRS